MPGLTRRLLLAVLATLVPAVAASPAGAAGHANTAGKPGPNVGIVDIYTTLGYENGVAAGTGMILSRSGEVLTNNHVITGATKFKVVDVTTHRSYAATVVGYSISRDVAVLQLAQASGLRTVRLGGSAPVRVGQQVVARGNAQGRGGAPKSAKGRIIALHRQIVAEDETGSAETLSNLIATNAPVVPVTPAGHSRTRGTACSAWSPQARSRALTGASRSPSSRRCRSRARSRAASRTPWSTSDRRHSSASSSGTCTEERR